MRDDTNPSYDSFVVRMWHDAKGEAVLRAEVEHVQTGAVDVRTGQYWAETSNWLRSRLLGDGRASVARAGRGDRRASRIVGTLVLAVTLLVTASSGAVASSPRPPSTPHRVGGIPVSARSLPAQLTASMNAPVSEKLDGLMNQVAQEARSAAKHGLEAARAGGARTLGGRIHALVTLDPARVDATSRAIEAVGGSVETLGNAGTMAQVFLPPRAIEGLAHRPDVLRIAAVPEVRAEAGNYLTEGFAKLNGPAWHSAGHNGSGVKVGIIDVGFQGYGSISTDLPASAIAGVRNFTDGENSSVVTGGGPHGTACAEIIHDIAPGASLYLAKVGSALDIEEAADWLQAQGVRLISSSIGVWNVSPGDGTGYLENVVAEKRAAGILWVTAAGNDRENHWGGAWTDANANGYLDFASGEDVNYLGSSPGNAYYIGAGNRFEVLVRWNDWTNPVDQDYKLYLVRLDPFVDAEWQVVADVNSPQTGLAGQEPTESAVYTTTGDAYYGFVIQRVSASVATNFEVFAHIGAGLAYPTYARSLANLGDSDSALTVAAIDVNALTQEPYSSQGPTNGAGGTQSGGKMKPDISGFANVSTASYGSASFNGTSAATPHVAGAAALVLDAQSAFTPTQLESFLTGRAVDQGAAGVDTLFGYGRLNLGTPPTGTGDIQPPTVSTPVTDFRPTSIAADTVPIKVSFSATDASGISATRLQVKVGAGSFTNVTLPSPTATSVDLGVGASATTTLQYQAQATDGASPANTSAFATAPQMTVRAYQNGATEIRQTGTWATESSSSHYGGSARYAGVSGTKQSLTARVTDFAIVSSRGPNRGKAQVYVDGVLKTTLDLYSPTAAFRQLVYVISFPSAATHTIELRPTGTKNAAATGKRVDLDAFLVVGGVGDITPPTVSAPVTDFRPAAISTGMLPIKVSFSASDASGISATRLEVKTGSGSFTNVTLPSATATSVDLGVAASSTTALQYRAEATDGASPLNTSPFATAPQLTVRAYQNGAAEVAQTGTWTTESSSIYYGGSVRYASAAGARQSLTARVTDFAIVSSRGPNRGKAQVYVDGVLKTTLDLYSPTVAAGQLVYVISFPSAATHTIQLRATGTKNASATGSRVYFDAFLAIRP